jgi:hypothetical protein
VLKLVFNTTILGDPNLPGIDWNSYPPVGHDWNSDPLVGHSALDKSLIEQYSAWDMSQHVLPPTRGDRILGVIMTTAPAVNAGFRVELPIFTSDHSATVSNISAPPRVKHLASVYALDFKRADYALINQLLYAVDWVGLSSQYDDINNLRLCFLNVISDVIKHAVPLVEQRATLVAAWHRALFLYGSDDGKSTKARIRSRIKTPTRRLLDN